MPFSCLAHVVTEKQGFTHHLDMYWPASWHMHTLCHGLSKSDFCLAVRAVNCRQKKREDTKLRWCESGGGKGRCST